MLGGGREKGNGKGQRPQEGASQLQVETGTQSSGKGEGWASVLLQGPREPQRAANGKSKGVEYVVG